MYFISVLFRFACFIVMFLVMLNQGWTRFGHILECDYLPSLRCKDSSIYNNNKNKWKPLVWMAKYYYGTAKNSVTSKKKKPFVSVVCKWINFICFSLFWSISARFALLTENRFRWYRERSELWTNANQFRPFCKSVCPVQEK